MHIIFILPILQLDTLSTQEGIDGLFGEDRYMAILNSSGWQTTKRLTPSNKSEFLDGLVRQELLVKREPQINAFGRGLEMLGVLTLIRQHWKEMRDSFVFCKNRILTAEVFLNAIVGIAPAEGMKKITYDWFIKYVKDRDTLGGFGNFMYS